MPRKRLMILKERVEINNRYIGLLAPLDKMQTLHTLSVWENKYSLLVCIAIWQIVSSYGNVDVFNAGQDIISIV